MTELKDKIIQCCFIEFLRRGFKACSMKNLEDVTHLTKGAFYYYFKDKKDILKEGIERYFMIMEIGNELNESDCETLKDYMHEVVVNKKKIADYSQKYFGTVINEVLFFQLVLEVSELFPIYREKIYTLSKKRLDSWKKVVSKAIGNGEVKGHLDVTLLANNLMSVSTSILNIDLEDREIDYVFEDMTNQFEQYYFLIKK